MKRIVGHFDGSYGECDEFGLACRGEMARQWVGGWDGQDLGRSVRHFPFPLSLPSLAPLREIVISLLATCESEKEKEWRNRMRTR